MTLFVGGANPASVFQLNGVDENGATYGLGWTLEKSPILLADLIKHLMGEPIDTKGALISLQKHGNDGGFTDLEIQSGQTFHVFIEAKKGWQVPGLTQLAKYRPRLKKNDPAHQRIVSLSSAHSSLVSRNLPSEVDGAKVVHLSWLNVQRLAKKASLRATKREEKFWLSELVLHMREFVAMEKTTDNNVYVVSLELDAMMPGGTHTWVDVIEKDQSYFHPVGQTWPVQPPNYVGFRSRGKLQSVHHVDDYEIMADVSLKNPLWFKTSGDHFVYKLGPAMKPAKEVKSGDIRNRRFVCALDTLLSGAYGTITEASDETKRRRAKLE